MTDDREKQIEEMANIAHNRNCNKIKGSCKNCEYYGKGHLCEYLFMSEKLYNAGYRKMDEVTLKLDLGDRTAEEIAQIAEAFNGDIKKQVAKEILEELRAKEVDDPECYDGWLVAVPMEDFKPIFERFGVEIEK